MRHTVLIADDNEAVRRSERRVLEQESEIAVVAEARDGQEAVRLAGELHPEVILMDICMPWMDGLKATRSIKTRFPEIKVIIITAFDESEYRRAAAESGADAFLAKGVAGAELHHLIRRLLVGRAN